MQLYEIICFAILRALCSLFPVNAVLYELLLSKLMSKVVISEAESFCILLGIAVAILVHFRRHLAMLVSRRDMQKIAEILMVAILEFVVMSLYRGAILKWRDGAVPISIAAIASALLGFAILAAGRKNKNYFAFLDPERRKAPSFREGKNGAVCAVLMAGGVLPSQLIKLNTQDDVKKQKRLIRLALCAHALALAVFVLVWAPVTYFTQSVEVNLLNCGIAIAAAFAVTLCALTMFWRRVKTGLSFKVFAYYSCIIAAVVAIFILLL